MGKTPFQRHKEEEEKRKKREQEEAAKLYEDFVDSFGDKEEEEGKSFVRGETIQPGAGPTSGVNAGLPKKGSSKYVPSFLPPTLAAAMGRDIKSEHKADESAFPTPTAREPRGKTRNIDKMLETMKRDQDARSERQRARKEKGSSFDLGPPIDDGLGSFDDGDPYTTNLYVGNLASSVDEEVLKQEFLRYGDIASIKVMWPRDDDQRRRGRNCGFVAFMTRAGAEKAKDELNGIVLHDLDLKIGWGKAVVLPPIPVYTQSGKGGLAPMLAAAKAKAASAYAPPPGQLALPPWQPLTQDVNPHQGLGEQVVVTVPSDMRARFIIDSVATYVMVDGCSFEQALMTREAGNPEFMFLFDLGCPEHAYYRWRLYSLAQGDSLRNWRNEPFVMVEGGPRWIPPSMTAMLHGKEQTAAQRGGEAKDKDKPLSDIQRDRFEDILRALTMERSKICEAMVFAIDNADSASEVVEILSDSLTLPETPMTTKVARLMLTSDVLHNSTAPVRNASRYRSLLEAGLPDIFESMQDTYRSLESRMHQEVLRRNVLRVLRIWRSRFIFSDDFLNGLQATFLKGKSKAAQNLGLKEELEQLEPEALVLRCRRNGLSREGGREVQIQRLVNLHAYLSEDAEPESAPTRPIMPSQEPLPAGLAGTSQGIFASNAQPADIKDVKVPEGGSILGPAVKPEVKAEVKQEEKKQVEGPVSKWTLVDYDDEASAFPGQTDVKDEDIFPDLEKTPVMDSNRAPAPGDSSPELDVLAISNDPGEPPDPVVESRGGGERMDAADEGRRARLRQIEVELLLMREGLEDKGLSKAEVEAKVSQQREKLLSSASLKTDGSDQPSTSSRGTDKKDSDSKEQPHKGKAQKGSKSEKSKSPKRDHNKDKPREKKESNKVKDRDKDKEREKERVWDKEKDTRHHGRSRSRSKGRRSRSRERSQDIHRDKGASTRTRAKLQSIESPIKTKKRERSLSKDRETKPSKKVAASSKEKKEKKERSRSRTPKKSKHSSRRK